MLSRDSFSTRGLLARTIMVITMRIVEGKYISDNSDLLVEVLKIFYVSKKSYIKAKLRISNKNNNIVYETKNYKLYLDKVKHWKRVT